MVIIYRFFFVLAFSSRILFHQAIIAQEYLYPVALFIDCDGKEKIYVAHQWSPTHINLWLWDPVTKIAEPAMAGMMCPIGLRILAGGHNGYSFLDRGRIRIKMADKRSSKALDCCDPVYDFSPITWIDTTSGYLSAKKRNRRGIFQISLHGDFNQLVLHRMSDCCSPCKVASTLFYLERFDDNGTHLVCTPYPTITYNKENSFNNSSTFESRVKDFLHSKQRDDGPPHSGTRTILDFGEKNLILLTMVTMTHGYTVEHHVDEKRGDMSLFSLHTIEYSLAGWRHRFLCSFSLPSAVLQELCEGAAILMPYFYNDNLYIFHAEDSGCIRPFYISSVFKQGVGPSELIELVVCDDGAPHHCVGIVFGRDDVYCGTSLENKQPFLGCGNDSSTRIELIKKSIC